MKLYHYTTFESFVKIWLSGKLKFGTLDNQNDIFESRKWFSTSGIYPDKLNRTREILKEYRQISLTKDYEQRAGYLSPMMWGHYANKGKGICIEIDSAELKLDGITCLHDNVEYVPDFPVPPAVPQDCETDDEIRHFVEENKQHFFFTKHVDWAGENEYRIVSRTESFLDISNTVYKVYISECGMDQLDMVRELTKDVDHDRRVRIFGIDRVANNLVPKDVTYKH